jgi:hypothetical protein
MKLDDDEEEKEKDSEDEDESEKENKNTMETKIDEEKIEMTLRNRLFKNMKPIKSGSAEKRRKVH